MALFDVNTGLCDQELCQLRWSWEVKVPELDTSVFVLPEEYAKNQEERVIVLNRLAREIHDTVDDMADGEFVLNEFVDRFGPRLAHLNSVIQVLAQLSSTPAATTAQSR